MAILISLMAILIPFLMVWSLKWIKNLHRIYNLLALVSLYLFSITTAIYVLRTIMDQTVYLTTIHSILLNPFFTITGAYFGNYILYRLLLLTCFEWKHLYSK